MSDIKFCCPHCGQHLEAPVDMAGQLIDCPSCSRPLEIPTASPQTEVSQRSQPHPQPLTRQENEGQIQPVSPKTAWTGAYSSNRGKRNPRALLYGVLVIGAVVVAGLMLFFRPYPRSPVDVVKRYLAAKQWEDRLPYVLHSDMVRKQMQERYRSFKGPVNFEEIKTFSNHPLSTDGWTLVYVVLSRRPGVLGSEEINDVLFFVLKTDKGYKIDWEATTIANPMSLTEFQARKPDTPVTLRVMAKLDKIEGESWLRNRFWKLMLVIPDQGFIFAFVEKDTDAGSKIFDLLRGGGKTPIIADVHYDNEIDEYVVDRLVQHGWAYREASGEDARRGVHKLPDDYYAKLYGFGYSQGQGWSSIYAVSGNLSGLSHNPQFPYSSTIVEESGRKTLSEWNPTDQELKAMMDGFVDAANKRSPKYPKHDGELLVTTPIDSRLKNQ